MHPSHVRYLVCPKDGSPLAINETRERDGDFIRSGSLASASGTVYPIVEYVPRFTGEDYAASFSVEWERHPWILHQTRSNLQMYRTRFNDETKWEQDLTGQLVLEAACGPGALTPYPLERNATVVSFDLSNSVTQARATIGPDARSLFVQASMFAMPFPPGIFDKCFCFGVIQSTPHPRKSFLELVRMLRPGGRIAADCYVVPDPVAPGGHRLIRAKYRFRRLGLAKLSPRLTHFLISRYVDVLWPVYKIARAHPRWLEPMRSLMFDDYRARLAGMDEKYHKEFAVLDMFDFLSPMYDFPETEEGFRQYFIDAGLTQIDVHPGYNGIEGRGTKPAQ